MHGDVEASLKKILAFFFSWLEACLNFLCYKETVKCINIISECCSFFLLIRLQYMSGRQIFPFILSKKMYIHVCIKCTYWLDI
jgi:hypothetical protein